jgi:hypothetical protein
MTCAPTAAWIATSNICRGISSVMLSTSSRPRRSALRAMHDRTSAFDASPLISTSSAHERPGRETLEMVFQRRIAARDRLELVEEIHDDLGQRQFVADLHLARQVVDRALRAALFLAQLDDVADVIRAASGRWRR